MNIRVGTKFKLTSWFDVVQVYEVISIFGDVVEVICLTTPNPSTTKLSWGNLMELSTDRNIFKEFKILSRVKLLSIRRKNVP